MRLTSNRPLQTMHMSESGHVQAVPGFYYIKACSPGKYPLSLAEC